MQFSIEGVNKNRATLSVAKLDSLNRAHLQRKLAPNASQAVREDLEQRALAVMHENQGGSNEPGTDTAAYAGRVLEALKVRRIRAGSSLGAEILTNLQERVYTINDIATLGPYFYSPPDLDSKIAKQLFKSVPTTAHRTFPGITSLRALTSLTLHLQAKHCNQRSQRLNRCHLSSMPRR